MHVLAEVHLHLFVQRQDLSRSAAVEIDGVRHDWDVMVGEREIYVRGGGL